MDKKLTTVKNLDYENLNNGIYYTNGNKTKAFRLFRLKRDDAFAYFFAVKNSKKDTSKNSRTVSFTFNNGTLLFPAFNNFIETTNGEIELPKRYNGTTIKTEKLNDSIKLVVNMNTSADTNWNVFTIGTKETCPNYEKINNLYECLSKEIDATNKTIGGKPFIFVLHYDTPIDQDVESTEMFD